MKSRIFTLLLLILTMNSCSSYEQFKYITEEFEIPSKVFNATYDQTWQAAIQVINKYDLSLQSQEAGVIKTRWVDNTLEMNFTESFGSKDAVKAAKFRLLVNVVKGFRGTREVTKVTIHKRQLVEHDFLQGWKEIPSDGIQEKTLLYRVKRVIKIDNKLKKIEDRRNKEIEAAF